MLPTFEQALAMVKEKVAEARTDPPGETSPLAEVRGRVLAEDVLADRDTPPFARAARDGFAVRSGDLGSLPVRLECVGEARAGKPWTGDLAGHPRACVEIMTGAPVPRGADAVVMIERVRVEGSKVEFERAIGRGENVVAKGSEARAGALVLPRGRRVRPAEMGLLAAVGRTEVRVFQRPTVAILSTGDEVVDHAAAPQWFEIRNTNAVTLAAQVEAAGGIPRLLGIAADRIEVLRERIQEGLKSDLLLISGGVSAGKYDFVEDVLAEAGAEAYFRGVMIQPGKPLVFGRAKEKFFFGLPGNPVSVFATFQLFARPALLMLAGAEPPPSPLFLRARLGKCVRQKPGLTRFLPAHVEAGAGDPAVSLVGWQGSGDLIGLAAANCFLVVRPDRPEIAEGEWVDVLTFDD